MHMVVGARIPPFSLLFMELGQMPLQCHWAKLAFTYWNSIVSRKDSLAHKVLRDDLRLYLVPVISRSDC